VNRDLSALNCVTWNLIPDDDAMAMNQLGPSFNPNHTYIHTQSYSHEILDKECILLAGIEL
jgi:hypothetical protein